MASGFGGFEPGGVDPADSWGVDPYGGWVSIPPIHGVRSMMRRFRSHQVQGCRSLVIRVSIPPNHGLRHGGHHLRSGVFDVCHWWVRSSTGRASDCRSAGRRFESGRTLVLMVSTLVLVGVVGNISACHADARGSIPRRGALFVTQQRHLGRVVKAVDSKSTGFRPRRFESYRCRLEASLA